MCVVFPDGPRDVAEVPGYEHLDPDDRPYVGINMLSPGQDLFHRFDMEGYARFAFQLAESNAICYQRYVKSMHFLHSKDL